MEFADVLSKRRMVRHYRPDLVAEETVERIVHAVRRAPSAGFSQGHRVVVVTDPDQRQRIVDLCEGWYVRLGYQPWLSQAPVHLVLGVREDSYHERYQEPDKLEGGSTEIPWPIPFWWFDAGALFMLLQLAAINEGLAAGFDSPADPDELAALGRIVNLPGDVAPIGVLTLGLPAEDPAEDPSGGSARLAQRRKPIGELVRWQRY